MSDAPQDDTWPPAPLRPQAREAAGRFDWKLLVSGVVCLVVGALGILLALFLGWEVATGEAGREMYHDGHTPPMTTADVVGLAALTALFMPPFGLVWGLPLCLHGAIKIRKSRPPGPAGPAA